MEYILRPLILSFAVFACAWLESGAKAAAQDIPQVIPIEGFLTDDQGEPIDGEQAPLVLRLYDEASGGRVLHSETTTVTPEQGVFGVELGASSPFDLELFRRHQNLYLGITVGEDEEAKPRMRLGAAPYAAVAAYAGEARTLEGVSATSLQSRISDSCKDNAAVQSVNEDGSVHCEPFARVGSCPDGQYMVGSGDDGLPLCRAEPAVVPASVSKLRAGGDLLLANTTVGKDAWATIAEASIRVTGPGKVLVFVNAMAKTDNCVVLNCEPEPINVRVGVTDAPGASPGYFFPAATGNRRGGAAVISQAITFMQPFSIHEAGEQTFYLKMRATDEHPDESLGASGALQLLFLPGAD